VDCFYALLAELTQTQIELADMATLQPKGDAGRVFCALMGLWSMAFFASVIGVAAGDLALPVMHAMRMQPPEPDALADHAGSDRHATVGGGGLPGSAARQFSSCVPIFPITRDRRW